MSESKSPLSNLEFLCHRTVWIRMGVGAVIVAAIGAIYSTVAPKWYRSTLTIVPVKSARSGVAGLLGSEFASMAAAFDSPLGGGADADRITAVLQSTVVTDAVIERFDLRTRYHQQYQEFTRSALWSHCRVRVLPKPGLVELGCEDKDPKFVKEMLEYFAEVGNQVFRRVGASSATEEVRVLEKRVLDLRAHADETADRMRAFQEEHHIVDLDTQARAVVSALAGLNEQRINRQLAYDVQRSYAAGDEPSLQSLQKQLDALESESRAMVQAPPSASGRAGGKGLFPAALSVPKLRAEYEQLYRDRRVAEATLVFTLERLESARAAEARDVSTFQVLDPPTLATRHSSPKRLLNTVLGACLGAFGMALLEWVRARRSGAVFTRRERAASGA